MPQLPHVKAASLMAPIALKAGIVLIWTAILATVNTFLIDAYWGELAFTAICTGAMAFCLGKADRKQ